MSVMPDNAARSGDNPPPLDVQAPPPEPPRPAVPYHASPPCPPAPVPARPPGAPYPVPPSAPEPVVLPVIVVELATVTAPPAMSGKPELVQRPPPLPPEPPPPPYPGPPAPPLPEP